MPAEFVGAVDVGGTTIKGALMDAEGRLHNLSRMPTGAEAGADQVLSNLMAMVRQVAADGRATAIGLGVPGHVDERRGVAVAATNIPWHEAPLRELVARETGLPVALGHDVRCGALAEGAYGAAKGAEDFLFVALGTGVGAGVVIGGRLCTGHAGLGGELGHTVLFPDGPLCHCGKRGCLEAISSAGAVARRYAEQAGVPPGTVPAEAVAARAAAGDAVAGRIMREAAAALGLALANYAELLNPAVIIVGGGLAEAGAPFLDQTAEAFRRWSQLPLHPTPILPAKLGVHAGLIGAGLLALRNLK